jgi:hypothetical protein
MDPYTTLVSVVSLFFNKPQGLAPYRQCAVCVHVPYEKTFVMHNATWTQTAHCQ